MIGIAEMPDLRNGRSPHAGGKWTGSQHMTAIEIPDVGNRQRALDNQGPEQQIFWRRCVEQGYVLKTEGGRHPSKRLSKVTCSKPKAAATLPSACANRPRVRATASSLDSDDCLSEVVM